MLLAVAATVQAGQSPSIHQVRPALTGFSPRIATVPANTLRFYLFFSVPMAHNQVSRLIRLRRSDGSTVVNPFLNLRAELWDSRQQRLTLFMDPGRIKRGVGPNARVGQALRAGQRFELVISGQMISAQGLSLGEDQVIAFHVGPAVRETIDPARWQVSLPSGGSSQPVAIQFPQPMDSGTARRMIKLIGPNRSPVVGRVIVDATRWSIEPEVPWLPGRYRILIDADLEDVAGNRIDLPFDAISGSQINTKKNFSRDIYIHSVQ